MQWEEMPMASSIIVVLHMRWVGLITFLIACALDYGGYKMVL